MNRQMMKLQQEEGFNPLSGCLPMLLQIPVFLGLYHVLRHLSAAAALSYQTNHPDRLKLYTFTKHETLSAAKAKIFGDVPLAASFHDSTNQIEKILGGHASATRITIVVLLAISAAATLGTQLLVRANATTPPEGTAATVQKLMLYVIPIGTLASGLLFNFPLGVLLYWFTSNLWTLGQQAYIIRYHPPTEEPDKPVGEVGKKLAPRPGQRPVRMTKAQQAAVTVDDDSDDEIATSKSEPGAGGATRNVPRPGQRPNRPSGKRPPAKRPTQAKKRR
jgi:YidC/Oxa1 family membrane protein insertase